MVTTNEVAACNYSLEVTPTGPTFVAAVTNLADEQRVALTRRRAVGTWAHIKFDVHGVEGQRKATVLVDGTRRRPTWR
jgi:hypothetical protein